MDWKGNDILMCGVVLHFFHLSDRRKVVGVLYAIWRKYIAFVWL